MMITVPEDWPFTLTNRFIHLPICRVDRAYRTHKCRGCGRMILRGEIRLGSSVYMSVGSKKTMQKYVVAYACVECGPKLLAEVEESLKKWTREYKKKILEDHELYVARNLGADMETMVTAFGKKQNKEVKVRLEEKKRLQRLMRPPIPHDKKKA